MARKIAEDGFVLSQAYKRLGELTDESSDRFNQEIFDQVRQTAYGASQWLKE